MFAWMLGVSACVLLLAVVLVYLELIDLPDLFEGLFSLIGAVLKLTAGLLFAVGAFFAWLIRRRGQSEKP